MKVTKTIVFVGLSFILTSCSTGYRSSLLDMKLPDTDLSISTTSSFEKNGEDLRNYPHDMRDAIAASKKSTDSVNTYFSKVTFNGDRIVNVKPNDGYLYKSKKLQNNDYYVEIDKIFKIDKQSNKQNCWAACLQYMIMCKYGKKIPQEKLIAAIKGDPNSNNAASIDEMSKLMGFRGMQISEESEDHLAVALGENQPVMIGTMGEGDKFGHARLIVGARYSFLVSKASFIQFVTSKKVFREFRVLDPWDQSDKIIPADEVVKDIKFLYSFDMNK